MRHGDGWPRWADSLAAIAAGNAVYFLVLLPRLPIWLQHRPFHIDAGLLFDFLCCLALYGIIRQLRKMRGRGA